MIAFIKKYWFFVLLGFIATVLVIINFFIPKNQPVEQPLIPAETYKGITPGQTTTQELSQLLGAPDPKQSDFSSNKLAYPREGGGPVHDAIIDNNQKVTLFKQRALTGNLKTYTDKYGTSEGIYYGPEAEVGFKTYVWATKGIAVVASANDGTIFEIWYFKPISLEIFLQTMGKELKTEFNQEDF
jgi:hypothetical protein